ncbi:hypothetical protein [Hominenteromicrobium sp.]
MACRFVGLRPEEMNFAKPKTASDVTPDVVPDVAPEKKTSRKPRAEAKHK